MAACSLHSQAAKSLDIGVEGSPEYFCPAQMDPELAKKLQYYAWRGHNLLGALDISRVDIRLDAKGQPCLIEINTLPGLTADFSDLCLIAKADNISYTDLILEILYLGASRSGLVDARELTPALKKANGSRVVYRR